MVPFRVRQPAEPCLRLFRLADFVRCDRAAGGEECVVQGEGTEPEGRAQIVDFVAESGEFGE